MRATRTILSSASTQKLQQISRAAAQPRPNRQSHQPALLSTLHYLPRGSASVTASFNSVRLADPPSASIREPRGSQLQPVAPRSSQPPDSGQKHQSTVLQKKKKKALAPPGTVVANTIVIRSDRVSAAKAPLRQRLGPRQRAGTRCSALTAGHQHAAGKNSSKQRIPRRKCSRGGSAPPVSLRQPGGRAEGARARHFLEPALPVIFPLLGSLTYMGGCRPMTALACRSIALLALQFPAPTLRGRTSFVGTRDLSFFALWRLTDEPTPRARAHLPNARASGMQLRRGAEALCARPRILVCSLCLFVSCLPVQRLYAG